MKEETDENCGLKKVTPIRIDPPEDLPHKPYSQNFEKDLSALLNCYSVENNSNTPDFILARYLVGCLKAFDKAVSRRGKWYGDGGKDE